MTYVFSVPPEYRESFKRFLNVAQVWNISNMEDISFDDTYELEELFDLWWKQLQQPPDNQPLIYCKVCNMRFNDPYNNDLCPRCQLKYENREVDNG